MRRLSCFLLLSLGGCDLKDDQAHAARLPSEPRQAAALRLVLDGRSVQTVSPRQLCVLPFEASSIDGCERLAGRQHEPDLLASIRAAVSTNAEQRPKIACARVSGEIRHGDSTLVGVGTVDGAIVDGFAESRVAWVWFHPAARGERVRVTPNPYVEVSDVQPIVDPAKC